VTRATNQSKAIGRIGGNVDVTSAAGFDMQAKLVGNAISAATTTSVAGGCRSANPTPSPISTLRSTSPSGQGGSIHAAQTITSWHF